MILLYHGIVEGVYPRDRWCVGQALPLPIFERHLDAVARSRRIVSLEEYLQIRKRYRRIRDVVALTFDDGLATSFDRVYPLLRARSIPATFFISISHLNHGPLLWFSYVNALCFEGVYDQIRIDGDTFPLSSLKQRMLARISLVARAQASGDPRAFIDKLISTHPLPSTVTTEYEGMTHEQLALFRDSSWLEPGAHTLTHPFLDQLNRAEQAKEIVESKRMLAELTGREIRYFAYPNGDYNRDTLSLVREADFEAGLATRPRNLENDDLFEIERVGIYSPSLLKFWLKTRVMPMARRLGLAAG
jgi:peptidoglycan/xylan/chitin deacetylase (PgdA/CDA1 family)